MRNSNFYWSIINRLGKGLVDVQSLSHLDLYGLVHFDQFDTLNPDTLKDLEQTQPDVENNLNKLYVVLKPYKENLRKLLDIIEDTLGKEEKTLPKGFDIKKEIIQNKKKLRNFLIVSRTEAKYTVEEAASLLVQFKDWQIIFNVWKDDLKDTNGTFGLKSKEDRETIGKILNLLKNEERKLKISRILG